MSTQLKGSGVDVALLLAAAAGWVGFVYPEAGAAVLMVALPGGEHADLLFRVRRPKGGTAVQARDEVSRLLASVYPEALRAWVVVPGGRGQRGFLPVPLD